MGSWRAHLDIVVNYVQIMSTDYFKNTINKNVNEIDYVNMSVLETARLILTQSCAMSKFR